VYPDTTAWIYDFSYSYNEPMSNFYFWHPAYDDYPVCGVSYWQCLAFLEWKSRILNKQYAKQKIKITCALPSEIEWDYASTAERVDDKIILMGPAYSNLCDRSWLTDLYVRGDSERYIIEIKDTSSNKNRSDKSYGREYVNERHDHPLRRFHLSHAVTYGDLILDGYFHTGPAELQAPSRKEEKNYTPEKHRITAYEQYAAHYDNATGISWMDGNVSEWMREDLDRNWRGVFEKHLIVPEGPYMKEEQIIRDYEKMYYERLPKQGKMVRGCNWFDERFAMHFGKNVEGMQAKTFCDPNAKHCTLGFRYVVYVEGY
jgi:formylglycine-generating enzyme required for sulfatase activity